jgi:hypothetical protein
MLCFRSVSPALITYVPSTTATLLRHCIGLLQLSFIAAIILEASCGLSVPLTLRRSMNRSERRKTQCFLKERHTQTPPPKLLLLYSCEINPHTHWLRDWASEPLWMLWWRKILISPYSSHYTKVPGSQNKQYINLNVSRYKHQRITTKKPPVSLWN